jgi:hypothetical protein
LGDFTRPNSNEFGQIYLDYLNQQAPKYIEDHLLFVDENILRTTRKGKFLSDGIASDLFLLNLGIFNINVKILRFSLS